MTKKNLLILTDWYEPGYKAGGPIQSIRNLVKEMHELYSISILTTDRDLGEKNVYPGIQTNQWIWREPGVEVNYVTKESLDATLLKDLIESRKPDFI
jgi:hypothetical protein